MRIALAQIDTTVGDIEGNLARSLDAVSAASERGADVTLLPELALTGYAPEDLVHKSHFVGDNRDALARLARGCDHTVIAGFVDCENGSLFNAAAVLSDGRIQSVYRKQHLPNYGVFDEERYFEPGDENLVVDIVGVPCALSVCEDVWKPGFAAEAARSGARVLLNISASPFHADKGREREAMLAERARESGLWVVYCNLVGGQDELVYDGRSVVISADGTLAARAASFEEDLLVVDLDLERSAALVSGGGMAELTQGAEETYAALVLGLRDYAKKNGFTDVVLGLSGGVDSALVATLACDALGAEHVHGVLMPSRYSSQGSIDDALVLANALGVETRTIPIEGVHQAFLDALAPSFAGREPGVAEENIQARVRGTLLMGLSNKFGWLALATGNKSELSVGYSTLYGDMVGGFAPIKDVFKTRVYELCRWRNEQAGREIIPESTITKPPSAELRPGQVDQDSLPPYEVLDAILERYVEADESRDQIVAAGFDTDTVDRVVALTDAAEYKRRQGPIGVKITTKAFGKDRRMPITNRYRG